MYASDPRSGFAQHNKNKIKEQVMKTFFPCLIIARSFECLYEWLAKFDVPAYESNCAHRGSHGDCETKFLSIILSSLLKDLWKLRYLFLNHRFYS